MSSASPDVEVASVRRKKEKMRKHKATDLNESDGNGNNLNSGMHCDILHVNLS